MTFTNSDVIVRLKSNWEILLLNILNDMKHIHIKAIKYIAECNLLHGTQNSS